MCWRCPCRRRSPNQGTSPLDSERVLGRLHGLHPRVIDLSLDRVRRLLSELGHPEHRLPPVVHVAGTNGKGSTIAFLQAILEAAGLRAHVLTSPHLVRFNERIVVAGAEIADTALVDVLETCEAANAGAPITFFEITTVAALLAFAGEPADVALLETGLGGRLDATNVVDEPTLTAITPVSIDHQAFLGDTLTAIATEKAGILKPGVPCVIAAQPQEAVGAIDARARDIGAPLVWRGTSWSIAEQEDRTVYTEPGKELVLPRPALAGAHQIDNAGVAVACALRLRTASFAVNDESIARGLLSARWPARLQRLDTGPLCGRLPAGWELWIDGGHNAAAAEAVAAHLGAVAGWPWHLVFGMLANKDPAAFLDALAPHVGRIMTVEIPGESASFPSADLAALARRAGLDARPATSLDAALETLGGTAPGPARVLIAGSLYLAGHALAAAAPHSTDSTHS